MEFKTYTRKPFIVEAVQITDENIEEAAKLLGELRVKDDAKYIALDKRIVPNIHRAFPGWWLTRMGDNLRCYSPKIFEEQFELAHPSVAYEFVMKQSAAEPLLD